MLENINSVCELWGLCSEKYGNKLALQDEYSKYNVTFEQLAKDVKSVAAALQHIGLEKGEHVAQFSENSSKWFITDQAVFTCGGANVVRGSLAPIAELEYIYSHSDSTALITDSPKIIEQMGDFLCEKNAKFIVYIGQKAIDNTHFNQMPIFTFDKLLEMGKELNFKKIPISRYDLATIIYSSGTTGAPKGVMLSHGNLISQVEQIDVSLSVPHKASVTSILPIWHAYERTCEYFLMYNGSTQSYTNIKNFKKDLAKYKPELMISVPRIWESVYEGISEQIKKQSIFVKTIFATCLNVSIRRKKALRILNNLDIDKPNPDFISKIIAKIISMSFYPFDMFNQKVIFKKVKQALGGRFKFGVSGGGAIARHVEDFFEAVEVSLLVGYGLTETAPVVCVRPIEENMLYATGTPLNNTEFLIVDPETLKPLKSREKGLVLIRGPQVMMGYYKNDEATKKVMLPNGYFISGDLGWLDERGVLTLTGRIKDLIVLSNGENIEPDAIEQSCMSSPFVSQIVLVGQDKAGLGALIVPNQDVIKEWALKHNTTFENACSNLELKKEVLKDIRTKVKSRRNYRAFENIQEIRFIDEPFTIENGLMTNTIKIRKNKVFDKYEKIIEDMYKV